MLDHTHHFSYIFLLHFIMPKKSCLKLVSVLTSEVNHIFPLYMSSEKMGCERCKRRDELDYCNLDDREKHFLMFMLDGCGQEMVNHTQAHCCLLFVLSLVPSTLYSLRSEISVDDFVLT
jgi:hypothetical protein